ncbi:peptidylprolyl isomerase CPR7 Ecym_1366 [Eremothecium cymbalariae DBVPG|uniref:peptidylprolyl isomerase n=1 Tax=Eremothecium cymbalariae (strain CBS 270.75 / DBVPG 7215 / KCTC 17166 / NRRL Y-17582) TaxID=931890 RepID=G8JND5_ERECY|nr:hypothetical protein Ecym_1366 [Eremothecium cymbalariae DBVPG\
MSCTRNAYLDISIDGKAVGRIVFQLFLDVAPMAAKNFLELCKGEVKIGDRQLSYKLNRFHRVIKNFMVQGGDIIFGSGENINPEEVGKGGCSIYAEKQDFENSKDGGSACFGNFKDENLEELKESFILAMANIGEKDTNSSQFFITTTATPHLNFQHSIFGRVIGGKSVVRSIEKCPTDKDGWPEVTVLIEDCGEWHEGMDIPLYNASNAPDGGDIYEEYPEDDTHFDGEDFQKAYEASNTIKESGTILFKRKDYQNAYYKYRKSLRYVNEYIPDIELDDERFLLFNKLKMKLYLNLSFVLFILSRHDESITYANYLIEMEGVTSLDKAKAYYRRGNCYLVKKRLEDALQDYKNCKEYNPNDEVVTKRILEIESKLEEKLEKTKKSISKFFQ